MQRATHWKGQRIAERLVAVPNYEKGAEAKPELATA
jgi:hypothetical protein